MKFSAAIFDMDGTIIDSMGFYEQIGHEFLQKIGLDGKNLEKLFFTQTSVELAELFVQKYGVPMSENQIINDLNDTFYKIYAEKIEAKPGAKEFLQILKEKNIKTSLLTASDRKIALPCLERTGLAQFFDHFVFCSEYKESKHESRIFHLTAQKLSEKPENIFVFEDALYAITTAKKAGFNTVGIFDNWCSQDWNQIKENSTIYGENFSEIREKILL